MRDSEPNNASDNSNTLSPNSEMSTPEAIIHEIPNSPLQVFSDDEEFGGIHTHAHTNVANISKKSPYPAWFFYFFACVVGSLILALPALVLSATMPSTSYLPSSLTSDDNIAICELYRWSCLLALVYFSATLTLTVINTIPSIIKKIRFMGRKQKDSVSHLVLIQNYFAFWVACIFVFFCVKELFLGFAPAIVEIAAVEGALTKDASAVSKLAFATEKAQKYLRATSIALLMFSSLLLIARICVQKIAINYHYEFYAQRIEKNQFMMAVLKKLVKKYSPKTSLAAYEGEDDAIDIGTALFKALTGKDRKNVDLKVSDFQHILNANDSERFFEAMDIDHNASLTCREMISGIKTVYDEHQDLTLSLASNDTLTARLDHLAVLLVVSTTIAFSLPIFQVPFIGSALTLLSTGVAFKFFLHDTMTGIFSVLVFIIFSHPFDVGDSVTFDGKRVSIVEIGWWNTSVLESENKLSYYQNQKLATMGIGNMRRSASQSEWITLKLHSKTSSSQLSGLETKMNEFIRANERDYTGTFSIAILSLDSCDSFTIGFSIVHKSNFHDSNISRKRKVKFMQHLLGQMTNLDIQLSGM